MCADATTDEKPGQARPASAAARQRECEIEKRGREVTSAASSTGRKVAPPETGDRAGTAIALSGAVALISGSITTDFPGGARWATTAILVGGGGKDYAEPRELLLRYANRHGLITGATGTGKTVTLQVLAEGLSAAGRAGGHPGRQGRRLRPVAAGRPGRQGARGADQARGADRHGRLRLPRLPGGVLGPVRPVRPPGAHARSARWGRCCSPG